MPADPDRGCMEKRSRPETAFNSVFAPGASGLCIKFKRNELVKAVGRHAHIYMHPVIYLRFNLWDERSDAVGLRMTRDVLDASNNSTVTRSGFGENN
jgi:hypothetical protein